MKMKSMKVLILCLLLISGARSLAQAQEKSFLPPSPHSFDLTQGPKQDLYDPNDYGFKAKLIRTEPQLTIDTKVRERMAEFYEKLGITPYTCDFSEKIHPASWKDHLDIFNTQPCFTNRTLTSTSKVDPDRELIEQDQLVCSCLRMHPVNKVAWDELASQVKNKGDIFIADLKTNIELKYQTINDKFATLMLQAGSLGSQKKMAADLREQYTQVMETPEIVIANCRAQLLEKAKSQLSKLDDRDQTARLTSIVNILQVPEGPDKLVEKMEQKGNKCFTMQAFMKDQQLPKGQDFFEGFQSLGGTFNEKDWDYEQLKKEYDDTWDLFQSQGNPRDKAQSELKIMHLKSRLTFLSHNPLIKNFMSARPEDMNRIVGLDYGQVSWRRTSEKKTQALRHPPEEFRLGPLPEGRLALLPQNHKGAQGGLHQ